jgi:hypothetical protein
MRRNPVNPTYYVRRRTSAFAIQDSDAMQGHAFGDTKRVAANDARHMRAVAGAVVAVSPVTNKVYLV